MRKAGHVDEGRDAAPGDPADGKKETTMTFKFALSAAVAGSALTALPATAQAQGRYGYYDGAGYQQNYRNHDRRYDRRGYDRRYANRYDQRYSNHYGQRCSGTTGTILGAIAGGLLGRSIDGGRNRAVGTIIGGAAGALAGRAIDRDNCRR